jgi:hypothetical protein
MRKEADQIDQSVFIQLLLTLSAGCHCVVFFGLLRFVWYLPQSSSALKHTPEQLQALERRATEVSNPASSHFRQYFTFAELNEQFTPPQEAANIVLAFVREKLGITEPQTAFSATSAVNSNTSSTTQSARVEVLPGGWVRIEGVTVRDAGLMLQAQFSIFEKIVSNEIPELEGASTDEPAIATEQSARTPPNTETRAVNHASDAPVIRSSSGFSLPADVAAHVSEARPSNSSGK